MVLLLCAFIALTGSGYSISGAATENFQIRAKWLSAIINCLPDTNICGLISRCAKSYGFTRSFADIGWGAQ